MGMQMISTNPMQSVENLKSTMNDKESLERMKTKFKYEDERKKTTMVN